MYVAHGRLSAALINATRGMPGSVFYESRFGGLTRAYSLVGFNPTRDYGYLKGYADRRRRLAALRQDIATWLSERGATVQWEGRRILVVNGRLRIAVMLGFCKVIEGQPVWLVQVGRPRADWVLIARLNPEGVGGDIQDYWLVPYTGRAYSLGVRHRKPRSRHQANTPEPLLNLILGRQGEAP